MASKRNAKRKKRARAGNPAQRVAPATSPSPPARPDLTALRTALLAELHALRDAGQIVLDATMDTERFGPDSVALAITLDTSTITAVPNGLPVNGTEPIVLLVRPGYPDRPPQSYVELDPRFVGYPHVVKGTLLCTHLDPSREWNPTYGLHQALQATVRWFDDAANDRFDARTSLHHAVGGAPPQTVPTPTVVVRTPPPPLKAMSVAHLRVRTAARLDHVAWAAGGDEDGLARALVLAVPEPLPFGLRSTLGPVLQQIHAAGGADPKKALSGLIRAAQARPSGSRAYLGLVVSHPTEPDLPAIVFGYLNADDADRLRRLDQTTGPDELEIHWMPASDERTDVTTARDVQRPPANFRGLTIEVWGCGGIGAWMAEFIVRAKPAKVTLRDGSPVHGGLLARQNFTEGDVGLPKMLALQQRLAALCDGSEIVLGTSDCVEALADGTFPPCDVIIDATVDERVRHRLAQVAATNLAGPLLVEVSLDSPTATLGLVTVAEPGAGVGPADVDRAAGETVTARADLEPFHTFWAEPAPGSELTPTPGCSVPTYHGSAADLAVIAGTAVTIVGQHLQGAATGSHLFSAPYSGTSPSHLFIPWVPPGGPAP